MYWDIQSTCLRKKESYFWFCRISPLVWTSYLDLCTSLPNWALNIIIFLCPLKCLHAWWVFFRSSAVFSLSCKLKISEPNPMSQLAVPWRSFIKEKKIILVIKIWSYFIRAIMTVTLWSKTLNGLQLGPNTKILLPNINPFFHTAPSPWPILTSPLLPKQPISAVVPQREEITRR